MVILLLNHHIGTSHTHALPSMYVCEGGQGRAEINEMLAMITDAEQKLSLISKSIIQIVHIVQPIGIGLVIEDDRWGEL